MSRAYPRPFTTIALSAVILIAAFTSVIHAQELSANPPAPAAAPDVAAAALDSATPGLFTRVGALERVIERARPDFGVTLLGPVASKVYDGGGDGLRFGLSADFMTAYGSEDNSSNDPAPARTNTLGLWPTLGYRAHPRVLFNAQFGFENGGAERSDTVTLRKGAAVVRFAYLDWLASPAATAGVRFGHQLVPVGLSNTGGDAVTYFGVRRPELEREVLPGDWHENGALAWFDARGVVLEAGAFSSLNARGLRGETFLSGGRSQGQNSPSADWLAVARANVSEGNWLVGGSFAAGRAAQNNAALTGAVVQVGDVHVRYRSRRVEVLGQTTQGRIAEAGVISALNDTVLGTKAAGSSVQAAFEVLGESGGANRRRAWAFVRQTEYDLHARVATGFTRNPSLNRRVTTVGLSYLPIPGVVIKVDGQRTQLATGADGTDVSLAGAFIF